MRRQERRNKFLKRFFNRLWESPTITTWGSFAARSLSLILVLPMVLRQLPPEDFTVWSLFSVIISLQGVAELGFGVTFARVVAYAMGGATDLNALSGRNCPDGPAGPNWALMDRILATMRLIYRRLTWVLAGALLIGGSAAVWRPIARTESPHSAWMAWIVVATVTLYAFRCNQFSNFLQGTSHISLLRRWETLFSLASIAASFLVLWFGGGLLLLVAVHQFWTLLSAARNGWLARYVFGRRYRLYPQASWDATVYSAVWPSAWRSGIGSAMSFGLVQASGVFHAQSRDLASVNSYLLGLRLVQSISQFSQAPFYSKLPLLATLYAEGNLGRMLALAKRGMKFAYWSFVAPAAVLAVFGPLLLQALGSSVPFPSTSLWLMLSSAILIERYGAMHLQLYTTTNHIVWHVANGITGAVMVLLWMVLYPRFGAIGLAAGMIGAYTAFFSWFSAMRSHRAFSLPFPGYDIATAGGAVLFFIAAGAVAMSAPFLR